MTSHTAESENSFAGMLCLVGFFLHIALSDPLLNALGVHYSGDEGKFYEKIHPGTVCIFLSLFVLLMRGRNPVERLIAITREHSAFAVLLAMYVLLFLYMAGRSGFSGLAFIIDTHMSAAICAIVLSYVAPSLCKKAVSIFLCAAVANALIGIVEAILKIRLFAFESGWSVLHEQYFRASAFIGHPLDNAIFTSVALFVLLAMDYPKWIKMIVAAVFFAALVAFGGRASIAFSAIAVALLAAMSLWRAVAWGKITEQQMFAIIGVVLCLPLLCAALYFLMAHHVIGERLLASASWDDSARSRLLALQAFSYMSDEEILFGVPGIRILEIAYRMSIMLPMKDIENPWVMMCMSLGVLLFPLWLAATMGFAFRLMNNRPFALQLAVAAYFIIASTSNTFGRKDANYAIMVCAVVCAGRYLFGGNASPSFAPRNFPRGVVAKSSSMQEVAG